MSDTAAYLKSCSELVESWLLDHLPNYNPISARLNDGMRYSVFAGGKRLRPALMYASYSVFADDIAIVTPFAASIEVLHTYSLIHDDLPAMDNDDMRRGKPTNHKVYGEASAILAGDALLTKAFELIADVKNSPKVSDNIRVKALYSLALAAGDRGMVAGQYADIEAESSKVSADIVDFIHYHKTASLIEYSVNIGGLLTGRPNQDMVNLGIFGRNIGLAFQITDDILDIESTSSELGKTAGKDIAENKATYPAVYGVDGSKKKVSELIEKALESLENYGAKADKLTDIANFITKRRA